VGSSVFKNARTKQHPQPYQFSLYTNAYFDKNLKNDHLKYPSKVFTLKVSQDKKAGKKGPVAENNSNNVGKIEVTTPTKSELDSLKKIDPVKYKGEETDFLKTKISNDLKLTADTIYYARKQSYTLNLSGPITRDPHKIKSIEILQLTDMEKDVLKNHNPEKYNDTTLKDYMAMKTSYINDEGQIVSETTYEKKPKN
jgi:hypothetical protein